MKLPGGIVGKTCYVLMAVCGALAAIVASIRTEAVGFVAIAALLVIVIWSLRRAFQFADANPDVALMEGAEIIAYRRMQLAQKGLGDLPDAIPVSAEGADRPPSPHDIEVALLPDPEPDSQDAVNIKRIKEVEG